VAPLIPTTAANIPSPQRSHAPNRRAVGPTQGARPENRFFRPGRCTIRIFPIQYEQRATLSAVQLAEMGPHGEYRGSPSTGVEVTSVKMTTPDAMSAYANQTPSPKKQKQGNDQNGDAGKYSHDYSPHHCSWYHSAVQLANPRDQAQRTFRAKPAAKSNRNPHIADCGQPKREQATTPWLTSYRSSFPWSSKDRPKRPAHHRGAKAAARMSAI